MDTYLVPDHEDETHRVMQHLPGRTTQIHEAVSVYGEIMCESCDSVIASRGQTLKVGSHCWRCHTMVVGFLPLWDEDGKFIDYRSEQGQQIEQGLVPKEHGV